MNKGYIFISNSSKPLKDINESLDPISPGSFSYSSIWAANQLGWQLHMGINRKYPENIKSLDFEIHFYDQHCYRNIFAIKDNWIAYRNLCKYLKKNPNIEIIHCNTPIGGVVGRVAGKKFGKKVIYTAHGFHFFKGAPLLNRTVLKWIEQWLAHYTDILITINQEDFEAAQKFKLKKGGRVFKIPGVGMNIDNYNGEKVDSIVIKRSLGFDNKTSLCIAIGDLNDNKNFISLINSFSFLKNSNVGLIICGKGPKEEFLKNEIHKLRLESKVKLLGFRTDIADLLHTSDIFLMSSKREGLPRSTMEAMASGLPCIVSDIRGNRDLIENGKGGYLVNPTDVVSFAKSIAKLIDNKELRNHMSKWNKERIKEFSIDIVKECINKIFSEEL